MENMDEEQSPNEFEILKNADISNNVVTLQELQMRRKELLLKRQQILNQTHVDSPSSVQKHPSQSKGVCLDIDTVADFDTMTTVFKPVQHESMSTIIEAISPQSSATYLEPVPPNPSTNLESVQFNSPKIIDSSSAIPGPILPNLSSSTMQPNNSADSVLDFSFDDDLRDPNYVPLSEITNVQPIKSNDNVDWFPERDCEPEEASQSRSRKKKADRGSWKRAANKKDRMMGKQYIGYKKVDSKYLQNELKPERIIGPKCNSAFCASSKIFFCSKLTDDERKDIFQRFWRMSWTDKKVYVSSLVVKTQTKRKTIGSNSRRFNSKAYYLQINGKKARVCLKTFLNTHGIKEWTIRYWLGDGRRNGTDLKDSLNTGPEQSTDNKRDSVKSYLTALPKLPSHYCRKSSTKLYLEPLIQSKSQLYNMYVDFAKSQPPIESITATIASRTLFSNILDEENIGLFQPKKDACDMCCSFKAGNVSDEIFQRHIELKNLARDEKTKDKALAKSGTIHSVTADLQAVKLCPSLNASSLYFKTKLAVHNFTIYNLGIDEVTCYWFDETACDLKASTYASMFIDNLSKLLDDDCKDVVIWTDGCTAQNRNSVVSNAFLRLAMAKNITITQKYLEKGHTQMEVDSVHSVIERKLKNVEIFLPSQYASITKEARKKPFPYKVVQPDHTFFRDYSAKDYQIYDSIRTGRTAGDDCVVDLRVLKYNPDGTIVYKKHFEDEFSPLPRRPKNISTLANNVLLLYPSRLPILESKYNHLQQLKSVIPQDCHSFYDNLPFKKK